jgi:hypothetical protein
MTTSPSKARYRQVRSGWGWFICLVWVGYWWSLFSGEHSEALAAMSGCDGVFGSMKCSISRSGIDGAFYAKMALIIIFAPLAWIPAHYIAARIVQSAERAEAKREEQEQAALSANQRRESEGRMAQAEQDAERARGQVERSDFMHKLGAVNDFLDLLASETDPSRIANMRLGAAQALRDLTAKHTIEQLAAFVRGDEAVKLSLTKTLRRLRAQKLHSAPEAHILKAALEMATPATAS